MQFSADVPQQTAINPLIRMTEQHRSQIENINPLYLGLLLQERLGSYKAKMFATIDFLVI